MKYTIHGFSQKAALEYGLKSDELLILRWFIDFIGTSKMKKFIIDENEEKREYYWVQYDFVREHLPILSCNKKNLAAKFKNLVEKGILKNYTLKKGGTYSLYCVGENYDRLIDDAEGYPKTGNGVTQEQVTGYPKTGNGLPENSPPVTRKQVNKDSSMYSSIESSNNNICAPDEAQKKESKKKALLEEYFEKFYDLYPRKIAKKEARKAFMKLKPDKDFLETVLVGLKKQKQTPDWIEKIKREIKYIPHPATWLNAGRWEDEVTTTVSPPDYTKTSEKSNDILEKRKRMAGILKEGDNYE